MSMSCGLAIVPVYCHASDTFTSCLMFLVSWLFSHVWIQPTSSLLFGAGFGGHLGA